MSTNFERGAKMEVNTGYSNLLKFITKRGEPVYLGIEDIEAIYRMRERQYLIADAKAHITEIAYRDYSVGNTEENYDRICNTIGLALTKSPICLPI
jgi:hypothetical protein